MVPVADLTRHSMKPIITSCPFMPSLFVRMQSSHLLTPPELNETMLRWQLYSAKSRSLIDYRPPFAVIFQVPAVRANISKDLVVRQIACIPRLVRFVEPFHSLFYSHSRLRCSQWFSQMPISMTCNV